MYNPSTKDHKMAVLKIGILTDWTKVFWCLQETYVIYRPVLEIQNLCRLNGNELQLLCLQDVVMETGVCRHQLSLINHLIWLC